MAEGKEEWIAIQEKTFTRWMNTYLKQRGLDIPEGQMAEACKDGVMLCNLFEIIGKDSMKAVTGGKFNKTPKMRIQMLENGNAAINYLTKKEIQLVNVGSNDIVDGNLKILLGMIWTVILRFEISEDGKKGLLLWLQRCTKGYKDVDVQNFTNSWNDGLAFCALIHHHRPDLLTFDDLQKANAADNCELAFKIAEEKLGIARLLDVEDVAGNPKPDDKSMIAYLSAFYKLFASQQKNENFVKAIERAVAITRRHEKLIDEYDGGSADLNGWIGDKTAAFTGAQLASNTAGIKDALDDFYAYKSKEKPGRQGKLLELEGVLGALQSSCKNNDRPVYEPAVGTEALENGWEALEKAENAYESQLRDTYAKFQEVDFKTQKFRSKAGKMDDWAAKNKGRFESKDYAGAEVGPVEAETMVNSHKIYESQLDQYKDTLKVLLGIVADVKEVPAHEDSAKVADQGDALSATMAGLEDAGKAYGEELDAKLAAEKALAEKHKEAAKEGELLLFELDNLDEAIQEPVIGNSAAACKEQLDNLNGPIAASLDACEGRLKELEGNVKELEEAGRANLRPEIMNLVNADAAVMDGLRMAQGKRKHRLVTLQAAEEQKEKLRLAFAEVAKEVKDYCGDKQKEAEGLAGTLQEQMAAVEALIAAHGDKAELMGRAEEANTAAEEAGVIINPHTTETIHSLRALWAEITKVFARTRDQLQENIMAEEGAKLTPEQYKEIKEVFDYFDQDGDNSLNMQEFKDGCEGLGLGLEDDEMESKMHQYSGGADECNFEQFSDFMLKELETGSTQPDVLNAFTSLAGAPFITMDQIAQNFKNADTKEYLGEKMPAGEAEGQKDYQAFTVTLFEK